MVLYPPGRAHEALIQLIGSLTQELINTIEVIRNIGLVCRKGS